MIKSTLNKVLLVMALLSVALVANAQGKVDTLYYDMDDCLIDHPAFAIRQRVVYTHSDSAIKNYIDYNLRTGKIMEEGKCSSIIINGNKAETVREGRMVQYNDNGSVQAECNFHNGKEHGVAKCYDQNGRLEWSITYADGVPHGELLHFVNGSLSEKRTYAHGLLNGKVITYHPNGNKHVESDYVNDKEHGKTIVYHENGNIAASVDMVNGVKHGVYKIYDETGKLVTVVKVVNGQYIL